MLLGHNKFVVKSSTKMFSSKKSFQILEADSGQALAAAEDITGFFAKLLGSTVIAVREQDNNQLVFTVGRSGMIFKKDQVLDAEGQVVGVYKSKMFSLGGGFHIYDKEGKHLAEMQGKMLKAEYKFLTPDRKSEMGSVSRTWGGLAKSMFSGDDTYGVQIAPQFAENEKVKMLILGASLAVESIFKKKKDKAKSGGGGGDE